MKKHYESVFVVLVYRNTDDLKDFLIRTRQIVKNYRVIVVDSIYNHTTTEKIRIISEKYDCDYLSVENKGYSYGNNQGIIYAYKRYDFDYIVISNPDILIQKYNPSVFLKDGITAPQIVNASGKHQNPMKPFHSNINESLCYIGFKKNDKIVLSIGIGVNKVYRCLWLILHKINKQFKKIYEAHGSFLIISSQSLQKLGVSFFDEHMFLFAEEDVLAYKAKKNNIRIEYNEEVSVLHKEDGSMKLGNLSQMSERYKSYVYYYENYVIGEHQKY